MEMSALTASFSETHGTSLTVFLKKLLLLRNARKSEALSSSALQPSTQCLMNDSNSDAYVHKMHKYDKTRQRTAEVYLTADVKSSCVCLPEERNLFTFNEEVVITALQYTVSGVVLGQNTGREKV